MSIYVVILMYLQVNYLQRCLNVILSIVLVIIKSNFYSVGNNGQEIGNFQQPAQSYAIKGRTCLLLNVFFTSFNCFLM